MTDAIVPPPRTPEQGVARPRWYRIGIGDLVLLLLIAGIGQTATGAMLLDPGIGWHLRTPDLILEHKAWPTTDPFSGPSVGQQWYANQWLGDLPLWLGWKYAGLNGITAVTLAFLLVTYRLLYTFLRNDGLTWPVAGLWTYFAALASYYAWMARPNLVTLLAVAILGRALSQYHEGQWAAKRLPWLLLLFVVWVNSHGGFIIGLVMIGLAAACELVPWFFHIDAAERSAAQRRCRNLVLLGGGCLVATLVNPYGWKIYPWVLSLLGNKYFMNLHTEWLSPDFHAEGSNRFALFIVLFPVLFAWSSYRPKLTGLALAAMWFYLALQSSRYVSLWVIVATPLLARTCLHFAWLNTRLQEGELRDFLRYRSGGWLGLGLVLVGLGVWAYVARPLVHHPELSPIQGVNTILSQRQPGEIILNHPNFGGYFTWYGWPEVRVWLDDRNEVHGQAAYERFFDLEKTTPGWEQALADTQATWLALLPKSPLVDRLSERPTEWHEVYRDKLIVVFRRQAPR